MSKMGRPKGAKNKHSFQVEEIAHKYDMEPFEILMLFARGDWEALGYDNAVYIMENAQGGTKIGYTIPPELRLKAAQEASKYLYSQKRAVELTGKDGNELKIVVEDYTSEK